jgi:hypothetical protein
MSIGNALSGMQSLAVMTANRFICGTISGTFVGAIFGLIGTLAQQADNIISHGNSVDPTEMYTDILINSMQGAALGFMNGGKDAVVDMYTNPLNIKDWVTAPQELQKMADEVMMHINNGDYFQATFVGMTGLAGTVLGQKLMNMFCFVEDTDVRVIPEDAVETTIVDTGSSNLYLYGYGTATIVGIVLCGIVLSSKKKNNVNEQLKQIGKHLIVSMNV